MRELAGKLYEVCATCGQIVRFDKPLLGSLHICVTEEEARAYRSQLTRLAGISRQTLERAKEREK